jgi:hypothetical protein
MGTRMILAVAACLFAVSVPSREFAAEMTLWEIAAPQGRSAVP